MKKNYLYKFTLLWKYTLEFNNVITVDLLSVAQGQKYKIPSENQIH